MTIKVLVLFLLVLGLSFYAWKDWFRSLCGLILLMAVLERTDMPKSMFGVQGMNPWNMLFIMIVIAWAAARRREGLVWDMPSYVSALLVMYLLVVLVGFVRAVLDRSYLENYSLTNQISDQLINTIKWVLPGLLVFDGCRTRSRVVMILVCVPLVYLLIAVQVIKHMPLDAVLGQSGRLDSLRMRLGGDVGYSAADLSVMLAGVPWGMLAALPLVRQRKYRVMLLAAAGVVTLGQVLTGGRAGYIAWGAIGVVLCLMKWPRYLILAPVFLVLASVLFPGAVSRMRQGFGTIDVDGQATVDKRAATTGRAVIWPLVIEKIGESPWIGYGCSAMRRTGLARQIESDEIETSFYHPHNMYLESLLDNGVLGSLPIFLFWGSAVIYSACLFRCDNRLYSAVGGLSLVLTLASLIGGISGQHFYPQEHTLGIWAAFFLTLRVRVEEKRARVMVFPAEGMPGVPWVARQRQPVPSMGNASLAAEPFRRD